MDRMPKPGEFYRHFKDKLYQVICIAHHSETDELLVVYQALYGEFKICARPLSMFVSEVDHEKYPEASQKYRFEKVDAPNITEVHNEKKAEEVTEDNSKKAFDKLTAFLDAEDYNDKYNIFQSMRSIADEKLLDSIAMSIDLGLKPGSVDEQYEQILYALKTRLRFEGVRLR